MSYPSVALNLSERNLLFKPKPRYTSSEEDRNSTRSPSPPRHPMLPESHLYPNYRSSFGPISNSFKYCGNFSIPCYTGFDSIPHLPGIEGDPTRLSSSVIPYNYECGSPHLPALRTPLPTMVNASHCNFHPYYYGHMKIPPHLQGYEYYFSNWRKPKRIRTAFSPSQLLTLENAFEKNHYVVGSERKQLSQILGLSETQVKVWFQNRRTKHKRQKQDGQSCSHKINGKDCLDSRETSSDEPSTSDDDEEETGSCKTSSPSEVDVESSLQKCQNSTPLVGEETHENSSKTANNTIWNPIMLKRTVLSKRVE